MRIIELTINDFEFFATNHPLRNFCQSSKYAKLMGEKGFNYDYIGYQDDSNNLIGASLILKKKIGPFSKYAYAPKGFLIDYYNTELLKIFVKDICDYYKKKGYIFIKINPEIIIGDINIKKNFTPKYNQNVKIIDDLKAIGFKRRRELKQLDFMMPRISPYINLKKFDHNKLDKEVKDKIKTSNKSGLNLEQSSNKEIAIFYDFIKDNTFENINFYRNILATFGNDAEFYLLKIDYESCLINARENYEKELEHNNICNEKIQEENNEKNLNEKMQSDKDLLNLKNDIVVATEGLRQNKYRYIGGVITIRYQNRISIVGFAYDKSFEKLYPSYYTYNTLIEKYKNDFDFLDLNGLGSNFSEESIAYTFNKNKTDFNPTIYEFIGEFDIILSEYQFNRIQSKGLLSKEFIPSHKFIEQKKDE